MSVAEELIVVLMMQQNNKWREVPYNRDSETTTEAI